MWKVVGSSWIRRRRRKDAEIPVDGAVSVLHVVAPNLAGLDKGLVG